MDIYDLRSLSKHGLRDYSASRVTDLATWCRDFAEASGDARYFSVGDALAALADWWSDHDERGGIPVQVANDLSATITRHLPDVLDAESASDGAQLARLFRFELMAQLGNVEDWIEAGYMTRHKPQT